MNNRVSDQRILHAMMVGVVDGYEPKQVLEIAFTATMLLGCKTWRDTRFLMSGLARHSGETFEVEVPDQGPIIFEWEDGLGAINLRLLE